VRNLIENANKYAGGAQVGLRCEAGSLEISVSDTGPGIPAHQFERALQPFQRLSKARESHRGGFGLGLAIAQAVARGHDGELILTNNSPSGLVATLRLPWPRI
jgi:signal transduction histidine kinase